MNERLPKFKGEKLLAEIRKSTAGLAYISETDAPVEPYSASSVEFQKLTDETRPKEMSSREFFARLTAERDWYGEREKETARQFALLEKLLEQNLRDLKVFKFGRIQIDIYVAGFDDDDTLMGIKTKAVET